MDFRSFKAHFKRIRGWSKRARLAKWAEIEANPSAFRTSMARGHLTVWVPQNPEVSLEELLVGDVSDTGRTLNLDRAAADHMLRGVGGGVQPSRCPTAVVGDPSRVDDGFDAIFQQPASQRGDLGQNSCLQQLAPGLLSGVQRSLSAFSSPGPSASENKCDDSDSDSDSENSDSDDEPAGVPPIQPKQVDTSSLPRSSGGSGTGAGIKRPLEVDRDDDKVSSVSRVSDSTAGSSKASKRKKPRRMPHWI